MTCLLQPPPQLVMLFSRGSLVPLTLLRGYAAPPEPPLALVCTWGQCPRSRSASRWHWMIGYSTAPASRPCLPRPSPPGAQPFPDTVFPVEVGSGEAWGRGRNLLLGVPASRLTAAWLWGKYGLLAFSFSFSEISLSILNLQGFSNSLIILCSVTLFKNLQWPLSHP